MSSDYFDEEEFDAKFDGGTLKRIFGLTRPHWRWVAGFMAAVALVSVLESYFTYMTKRIIDEAIIPQSPDALTGLILIYGLLLIGFACGVFTFVYLAGVLGHRVQYDLRKRLFNHLQELSFSYFDKTPVGWIMSRLTSDTERIAELVTWGLLDVTWAAMNIVTGVIFMLVINWRLALVVFALIPVLAVIAIWFKQKILVHFRQARKINSKITGAHNENITGVRVVKALRREQRNLEEFGVLTDDMYNASFRAAWYSALFLPTVQLLSAVALGLIVWGGGHMANDGTMTIGGIQAFIAYVTFMLWPIQDLARVYASMQQAIASAERAFSLLDTEAQIVNRPNAYDPGTLAAEIEFDHVEFYYEEDKPVLRDFSLRVRARRDDCPGRPDRRG